MGTATAVPGWVPAQYQSDVAVASAQWNVPAAILSAVLYIESGFNPNAQSGAGAEGIAQFEPGTAAQYGVNPWDAQSSINGSAHYLSDMYAQFGSWTNALAAYNGGPGAIHNGQPSAETAGYASTVLAKAGTADATLASAAKSSPTLSQAEYDAMSLEQLNQAAHSISANNETAGARIYKALTTVVGPKYGISFDGSVRYGIDKQSKRTLDPTGKAYGWKGTQAEWNTYTDALTTAGNAVAQHKGVAGAGNKALDSITTLVSFFEKIFADITSAKKWERLGLLLLGGILAIGGVYVTMNGLNPPKGGGTKIVPIPI